MSPAEWEEQQSARRRETWRRNIRYIGTFAGYIGTYAGYIVTYARHIPTYARHIRTYAVRVGVYAVGSLLVFWCALEWWWFWHG